MDDPDSEREDPADSSTSLQVAMGFPVTASLGPVGPLLRQLYSRPEEEIQMLTKDLDGLCISLMDHSEAEEPSLSWMSEIRELCYDTKNYLDDDQFISKQDDDVQLTPQEKLEITQLKFNALKARVEHASKRFKKYRIDRQNINKANFFTAGGRHRLPVPMIDDGLMDTLANKLMGTAEEKSLKALSFVGLEGAGKTTLARRLYNHMGGKFQCRAFAKVSPNPDMRMFLTSIFTQIQLKGFSEGVSAPACCLDAQDLITNIKTHLRDKRYMIIIDDLWSVSVWDIIRRAFPDGDRGSRIITTTQFEDVASACCGYQSKYIFEMESLKDSESRKLLFSMVLSSEDNVGYSEDFVRVSDGIISKCGGLPLLIVGIACLLPNPIELNLLQWINIRDSLPSTVKNSEGIKEFVNFIYNNLSHELQTCLLYLAMYPEGYLISKEDLVKQWVVEGFIGEGQNKQETAREYFDELVSRGMIQAVDMNYRGVLSCTLHHIVHDLIVKKSMEGNFIIGVDYFRSVTRLRVKARRLSVQFGGARSTRIPDIIVLSEVRSLAYFGFYGCAHFIDKCMLLRILTLHVWADATYDLSGISKLLPLRYLKIVCNMAVKLPDKIQALQYMETLEIDATVAAIPSDIGRLSRLSSLKIGVRVLSRQDICILQALPALLALSLHVWAEPVEMIRFDTGDFSVLKYFEFRCSVPWLKFEAGSMPHLQILNLCFNAHEADQLSIMPIGIEDLTGLEEITAEIWGTDTDVGSTFRTAIRNHPSNPRISVELVDCMNFYADTSQSMGTEEKEYMSKDHDKGEEEKTGDADRSTSMSPGSKRMSTLLGSSVPVRGAAKKPTLEIEIDGIKVKAHTFAYGPEKKMDGPEKMDIEDSRPSSPTNSQMSKRMDEHAPGRPKAPVALWSAGLDGNAASEADFSSGDPISVPWTDDNVNTKPEKTVKNISTREGTSMDNTTGPPKAMSLQLLEEITDGFSNYRKLGGGTYGDVYLGVHKNGEKIAVKVLKDVLHLDDEQFEKEHRSLASLHHKNVVRLVGYCHETKKECMPYNGRMVFAEKTKRVLCFEYMHNGSLGNFIYDKSNRHNWCTRYAIIKGICEGLEYLHEKLEPPMYHLDLKPSNVLLDENMSAKIADFGVSRLFLDEKTRKTDSALGTCGYIPPEYINDGLISTKFDIFSLGVVIIKIMTGQEGYFRIDDMSSEQFIELVHMDWMNRLQAISVHLYSVQVRRCIEIALICVEANRHKRPSIGLIVRTLNKTESCVQIVDALRNDSASSINQLCPCITTDHKMLELLKEKLISYQLCITDNRSVAHLVTITTACDPEVGMSKSEPVRPRIKIIDYTEGLSVALSMDVHSTKPWILICHADGNVSIWNHQNQTRVMAINDKIREFRPRSTIRAAKFIEPLQAFVFGDTLGYIHVYSYEKVEKLQNFRGHAYRVSSLAVHPSEPLVLSASGVGLIKLWNWEAGWQCIRTFEGHSGHVCQVKFNPQTAGNTFASCSLDSTIKMWNMDSPTPVASFKCDLECTFGLDYFCPGGALQYLVARSVSDGSAQIWDLQSNTCIKRISGLQKLGCNIAVVEGPSGRPILLTVSEDRIVAFCDSTTHRYENRVNFNLGFVMDFAYITMTKSLVILCMHGIALMEID